MNGKPSLFSSAESEIVERHDFFRRWFIERSEPAGEEFERCERAFAAEFAMVSPDGRLHGRAAVLERLRKARGSMDPNLEIAVEAITPLWQSVDAVLIGYVEAQSLDGGRSRRRSSALFERRAAAPHGVAWRHLHETWM